MPVKYIHTIEDMDAVYGGSPWGKLVYDYLTKADDPLLSTTAGNYQVRYGAFVWWQLNAEANIFGVQRKEPWPGESGWRVMRAFPATKAVRIAENATLPDTVKVTYDIVSQKPQTAYTPFDMSEIAAILSRGNEAIGFEQLRNDMGKTHALGVSEQLFAEADDGPYTDGFTSIDAIVGSNSGLAALTAATTDKYDVFGLDRDAGAAWHDAQVDHNSGVLRPLSLDLIDTLEREVAENTGDWSPEGKVWVTGHDTFERWARLLQPLQRFQDAMFTTADFNGIRTVPGREGGFRLHMYNGKPILVSQHAPEGLIANRATALDQIFLLDTRYLFMAVAVPTVYREAGVSTGQEILLGRFGTEAGYKTVGDELCMFFKAQGKLVDIS